MTTGRRSSAHPATSMAQVTRAVAAAFLVAILTSGSVAAASARDESFGDRGVAQVDFGGEDRAVSGFLLGSGSYLLVGQSETAAGVVRIALTRMLPDGRLDRSFANDGRALAAPIPIGGVEDATRMPTGKIVVLVHDTADRHALVRLSADGAVDATFGSDGVVRTTSRSYGWGSVMALPSGKVLVATDELVRLDTDGAIDGSFGRKGKIDLGGTFNGALARERDGDLLVFGPCGACVVGRRYDADGHRDRSFGRAIDSNAFVSVSSRYGVTGIPMAVTVSHRGRIFLGSLAGKGRNGFDGLAVAFTRKGKPATGFHRDGWRTVDFGGLEWFSGVASLPNGRILLAGTRLPRAKAPSNAIVLAMLNADGSLRHRFGNRGRVLTKARTGREAPGAFDLFLDGNRAVVVGEGGTDFLVARYRLGT